MSRVCAILLESNITDEWRVDVGHHEVDIDLSNEEVRNVAIA